MSEAVTFADAIAKIVSYTIIHVATPVFADQTPYGLAVIETADGERQLVRLLDIDPESLSVGLQVVYDRSDDHGPIYRLKDAGN